MEPQAARPPPETNLEDLILMAGQPTPPEPRTPPPPDIAGFMINEKPIGFP